jgi:hypothetical protein
METWTFIMELWRLEMEPWAAASGRRLKAVWWETGSGSGAAFSEKLNPCHENVDSLPWCWCFLSALFSGPILANWPTASGPNPCSQKVPHCTGIFISFLCQKLTLCYRLSSNILIDVRKTNQFLFVSESTHIMITQLEKYPYLILIVLLMLIKVTSSYVFIFIFCVAAVASVGRWRVSGWFCQVYAGTTLHLNFL